MSFWGISIACPPFAAAPAGCTSRPRVGDIPGGAFTHRDLGRADVEAVALEDEDWPPKRFGILDIPARLGSNTHLPCAGLSCVATLHL